MAYRIYRSDDPGAIAAGLPILPRSANAVSTSPAALITILDAVLVNGYAGKPPAGWTKPFASDGTRHMYLSGSATGAALRIESDTTYGSVNVSVMTNPTSLTTTAIIGTNAIRCGDRSGGAWVIFADDKSFMIYSRGGSALSLTGGIWNLHYFGEVTNFENQAEALGVCFVGSVGTAAYSGFPGQWTPAILSTANTNSTHLLLRINHSSAAIQDIRICGGPFFRWHGSAQYQVPLSSTNGKVLASDVFLTSNNTLLSKFRGLKTLESAFWGASNPLDILTLDGKKCAIIYVYSNAAAPLTAGVSSEAMFLVEVE